MIHLEMKREKVAATEGYGDVGVANLLTGFTDGFNTVGSRLADVVQDYKAFTLDGQTIENATRLF